MKTAIPLNSETSGDILPKRTFSDLYEQVFDEGRRYFWRMNSEGLLELIIVFEDIEDFERSLDSRAIIDFSSYKERFLVIVWTVSDPVNPLGFPISFQKYESVDVQALDTMFQQEATVIHYLSILEDELLHIYSQTSVLSEEDTLRAREILSDTAVSDKTFEDAAMKVREVHDLTDQQLMADGIGYLLDYSSLTNKIEDELAKEKVMSALLSAVSQFIKHPRPEVRESSFMVWVGEKPEITAKGEASVLMEIYMTPPLFDLFDVVHDDQLIENPLTTVILSFPEFLTTLEAKPSDRGAYPLIEYQGQAIYLIEPNEILQKRLAKVCRSRPNPYFGKGDGEANGETETN